jgi:hypothetical protein
VPTVIYADTNDGLYSFSLVLSPAKTSVLYWWRIIMNLQAKKLFVVN